jgi:hypothetical protein
MPKTKSKTQKRRSKTDSFDSVKAKVSSIFSELTGARARQLDGPIQAKKINSRLAASLKGHFSKKVANEIAFHLVDWNSDAAFLVAVHLFPERFSKAEILAGIFLFLPHVPSHVIAAARLAGYSTDDIFRKG